MSSPFNSFCVFSRHSTFTWGLRKPVAIKAGGSKAFRSSAPVFRYWTHQTITCTPPQTQEHPPSYSADHLGFPLGSRFRYSFWIKTNKQKTRHKKTPTPQTKGNMKPISLTCPLYFSYTIWQTQCLCNPLWGHKAVSRNFFKWREGCVSCCFWCIWGQVTTCWWRR